MVSRMTSLMDHLNGLLTLCARRPAAILNASCNNSVTLKEHCSRMDASAHQPAATTGNRSDQNMTEKKGDFFWRQ